LRITVEPATLCSKELAATESHFGKSLGTSARGVSRECRIELFASWCAAQPATHSLNTCSFAHAGFAVEPLRVLERNEGSTDETSAGW